MNLTLVFRLGVASGRANVAHEDTALEGPKTALKVTSIVDRP